MKTSTYSFIYEDENGKKSLQFNGCHQAKSLAGRVANQDNFKRGVVREDATGKVFLYVEKGHSERTVIVKSTEAIVPDAPENEMMFSLE